MYTVHSECPCMAQPYFITLLIRLEKFYYKKQEMIKKTGQNVHSAL